MPIALAGTLLAGPVIANDIVEIQDKWYNRGVTGKVVNKIPHDNLIAAAKLPEWEKVPVPGNPNYYNLCIPGYSLCMYSEYWKNAIEKTLKVGYLSNVYPKEAAQWKTEPVPGWQGYHTITNGLGDKMQWEHEYPETIIPSANNKGWWSSYFTQIDKTPRPPVHTFNEYSQPFFIGQSRTQQEIKYDKKDDEKIVATSDAKIKVRVTGDFDNGNENATVRFDGEDLPRKVNGVVDGKSKTITEGNPILGGQNCGTPGNVVEFTLPKATIQKYIEDGKINVQFDNSSKVNNAGDTQCPGKHELNIEVDKKVEKKVVTPPVNTDTGWGPPIASGAEYRLSAAYAPPSVQSTGAYVAGYTHQCKSKTANANNNFDPKKPNPWCDTYALDFSTRNQDGTGKFKAIATKAGTLAAREDYADKSYGKTVVINHGDGTYSRYAHLYNFDTKILNGIVGVTSITKEQVLGVVGNTGNSTGPHLHFAMYKYNEVNKYLESLKPELIGSLGGMTGFPSGYYQGNPKLENKNGKLTCSLECSGKETLSNDGGILTNAFELKSSQ